MHFLGVIKLPLSTHSDWEELKARRPSMAKVFFELVLPTSLLPPALIYYAGTHYPEAFIAGAANVHWLEITIMFFLAELLTFAGMGWLIQSVAETDELKIDLHDAYLLGAIAPMPLWLSSLGLLVPSLIFNMFLAAVALFLSCGIIYNGIQVLCRTQEPIVAANVTQVVISCGLLAWFMLMMIIVLPVMS
jgi:hypothetical protein